jgi:hypothetical protein
MKPRQSQKISVTRKASKSIKDNLPSFLVIAIALAVFTSFLNLPGLSGEFTVTGAATSSAMGVSNLTISGLTSITNNVRSIEFGSGFVDDGCTSCVMDSNGQHNQTGLCCLGFFNTSSGFLLENTGNTNLSVNYTCSGSCTAEDFIGGTDPEFKLKVTSNYLAEQSGETTADTTASCGLLVNDVQYYGWNISDSPGTDLTTPEATYIDISTGGSWLCGNMTNFPLNSTDVSDAAVIDINVSIPADAPAGDLKTATFTFNAMSSG